MADIGEIYWAKNTTNGFEPWFPCRWSERLDCQQAPNFLYMPRK